MKVKQPPLIRLVDDDPNVLSSEAYLLRVKGWQVAAYSNAEDFLLHDDPAVPGCIVLDIRMPGARRVSEISCLMG